MTQFEQSLDNLKNSLDAQQTQHFNERWAAIRSTELAPYRAQMEKECNEAIALLQQQKEAAIAEKESTLKANLQADIDYKFGAARKKLEEAQALFATSE